MPVFSIEKALLANWYRLMRMYLLKEVAFNSLFLLKTPEN
jgi:hypothetical protein